MLGAKSTPAPISSSGVGALTVTIDRAAKTGTYKLLLAKLAAYKFSHIHVGNASTNGPIILWLDPPAAGDAKAVVPADVGAKFVSGSFSAANLTKEIAGWDAFVAALDAGCVRACVCVCVCVCVCARMRSGVLLFGRLCCFVRCCFLVRVVLLAGAHAYELRSHCSHLSLSPTRHPQHNTRAPPKTQQQPVRQQPHRRAPVRRNPRAADVIALNVIANDEEENAQLILGAASFVLFFPALLGMEFQRRRRLGSAVLPSCCCFCERKADITNTVGGSCTQGNNHGAAAAHRFSFSHTHTHTQSCARMWAVLHTKQHSRVCLLAKTR
jgi:hypothetical protein